jgi:hypothetical protein
MSRLLCHLSYTAAGPATTSHDATDAAEVVATWSSPNTESNRRPSPYHGDALPTELLGRAGIEDTRSNVGLRNLIPAA